jgi:O-antigen/teichoic acid export membrane protein
MVLLQKNSFARNVMTLMTGTTLSQVITFGITFILTRLYDQSDFGVLTTFISIGTILSIVSCLSYELTIVLPENDEEAANLFGLSVLLCIAMCLLTSIALIFFYRPITAIYNEPKLSDWLWLLPISQGAMGFYQACNYWSTRKKSFKRLAISRVSQSVFASGVQLGGGYIKPVSAGGLVVGQTFGQIAASLILLLQIFRDDGKILRKSFSLTMMKLLAKRYGKFPIYSAPLLFTNTLALQCPSLILLYYFTADDVGMYGICYKVLATPLFLIGTSMAQVFFPKAAEAKLSGDLAKLIRKLFFHLVKIGIVPLILFMIFAPKLFLLFGSSWEPAGVYARWLAPWFFFQFLSSPLTHVFYVLERQSLLLGWNVLLLTSRIAVIVIGGWYHNPLLTMILLGATSAVIYGILIVMIFSLVGEKKVFTTEGTENTKKEEITP